MCKIVFKRQFLKKSITLIKKLWLTWNLAHILRNLRIFKKAKKPFEYDLTISAFSAGNLAFTCFC